MTQSCAIKTHCQRFALQIVFRHHYQIIGDTKHHFDDKEVIAETFEEMKN